MDANYLIRVINFIRHRHQCEISEIRVYISNNYMWFDLLVEDAKHTYILSNENLSVLRYEMKQTIERI